jgi:hypothetical protein
MGVFNRFAQRFFSRARSERFRERAAVLYGQFVQAAYSMHAAAPNNLTPSLSCWHSLATYLSLIDPTLQSQ